MFERFTERARQVVVLAQDEARALKHNYIGTEHLLLGLLREEEGIASRILEAKGITVDVVRARVRALVGEGNEVVEGKVPYTPRARKVLELSLREALSLGHNYIGTEHILLALGREGGGFGVRILLDFDFDADKIRDAVIALLVGPSWRRAVTSTNGLNEETVAVLEMTIVDNHRELVRCERDINRVENELSELGDQHANHVAAIKALEETLGEQWSSMMEQRVLAR